MANRKIKVPEQPPGGYAALPYAVIDSPAFLGANLAAKVVLFAILRQHNGRNNGHFRATLEAMQRFAGIKSNDTINNAIKELIARKLIVCTKRGGLNAGAALYGVTWLPVTDDRTLDAKASAFAPGAWKFLEQSGSDKSPKRDTTHATRARAANARKKYEDRAALEERGNKTVQGSPCDGAAHTVARCSATPSSGAEGARSAPSDGSKEVDFSPSAAPSDGDKCNVPGALEAVSRSGGDKGTRKKGKKSSRVSVPPATDTEIEATPAHGPIRDTD